MFVPEPSSSPAGVSGCGSTSYNSTTVAWSHNEHIKKVCRAEHGRAHYFNLTICEAASRNAGYAYVTMHKATSKHSALPRLSQSMSAAADTQRLQNANLGCSCCH